MPWDSATIAKYHAFSKDYVQNYQRRIDCADLAIASLVDFAAEGSLNIRLKYYAGGWKWYEFDPKSDDAPQFKSKAMRMLGALNVIDNTEPILIGLAQPGDLIMSRWSTTLGHTRIIHSITQDRKSKKHEVVWYQGNLPPVVPERREDYFSEIEGVYGGSPRRWKFKQFDE